MKELTIKPVLPPNEVIKLEVTPDSRPLAGAAWLATPTNLEDFGYVEEEYIIGGDACVYSWPDSSKAPIIVREDGKYRTRILVRKPKDPSKFSGFVAMECFNGSNMIDHQSAGWGLTQEYLLDSGDAWVGFTKDFHCFSVLEQFDPKRYANLGFPNPKPVQERGKPGWDPLIEYYRVNNRDLALIIDSAYERGLTYDATFQIASLLKSRNDNSPLTGYDVKKVIAFGINDYNTFIAALHPYLRLENGDPVFDGYLMYMSGEGGAINFEEDMYQFEDERCRRTCDVPVIKVETAGDLLGIWPHPLWASLWRCEDSDEPGKQMRWYEIPGLGVMGAFRQDKISFACDLDYLKLGLEDRLKQRLHFDYWNQMCIHIVVGAYNNLKVWISGGTPPPHAEKISLRGRYPDVTFNLDQFGNHIGGIRHTYLEVPIARFDDAANIEMFDLSLRNRLYSDKSDYISKVRAHAEKMVKDRWILPPAVEMLVTQAETLGWS
jgi:hypothetical protein